MARTTLGACLLVCAFLPAQEQTRADLGAEIRGILETERERGKIPGLSASILENGETIAIAAVGVRRADREEPVTTDDVWHLGSCTKSMTATMIAILVEREDLAWDTTIAAILDDERVHPGFQAATLEQLLCHRSGAPPNATPADWARMETVDEDAGIAARRRVVALSILRDAPETPPGTAFAYSNAGFLIAGVIAETVTGKSWEELMRAEIFTPLGMESAGFGPPGEKDAVLQPFGHLRVGPTPGFHDNPAELGPAGTVHASLRDWARYVDVHLRRGRGENALLPSTAFERLHTPYPGQGTTYAFGWIVFEEQEGRPIWHNGSNTYWYCETKLYPERNRAYLVALNIADRQASTRILEALEALRP